MAKKSKTLKQKVASDKRLVDKKTEPTQTPFQYVYTGSKSSSPTAKMQKTDITMIESYNHITHDLRKTIFVTTFIVFIQILIYYFMYFS